MVMSEMYMSEEEILTALFTSAIEVGLLSRRFEGGRIGLLFAVFARQFESLISIMNEYVSQFTLETVTDEALLESLLKPYISIRIASNAKVVLEFTRDPTFNDNIVIPAGFTVSTLGSDPVIFETVEDLYMWKGTKKAKVLAYCTEVGSAYNIDEDTLVYLVESEYRADISVTNPKSAWSGRDDESLESARERALSTSWRYLREGTERDIENQIEELGLTKRFYKIVEYYDGYGSVLLALDIPNEFEYEDIKTELNYNRIAGINYRFQKVERLYVNFLIEILLTGEKNITYGESQELYKFIEDNIQDYFGIGMMVGKSLSLNDLKSSIQYSIPSEFKVLDFNIKITNDDLTIDDKHIVVGVSENLYPNKVTTKLNYEGY